MRISHDVRRDAERIAGLAEKADQFRDAGSTLYVPQPALPDVPQPALSAPL
jgi:hypothetical protein